MSGDDTPTLGYAPIPPKPRRNRVALLAGVGVAAIAVTVAGMRYFATVATPVRLPGSVAPVGLTWQTQPTSDPTTQPAADTSTQTTAAEQ